MNSTFLIFIIVATIILIIVLYKWLKPYVIKHDTTITINGGLGSGKTLHSVKLAIILLRKNRFLKYKLWNWWNCTILNTIKTWINKAHLSHNLRKPKKTPKKIYKLAEKRKKPQLYSNIPIHYKTHSIGFQREWSKILTEKHLMLLKEITEYSIVLIDEFPQFIDQFMWKEEIVQQNLNEFITFFRHYISGYLIINAQSSDEIECHFRRKLNQAIWCFNFKKWLFGLFYTCDMCDVMLSDQIQTMSTTYIEDNTKKHFGLFPPRGTYDTRCYSIRYKNIYEQAKPRKEFDKLKTNKVLRMREYISPLDEETTTMQKEQMKEKIETLERK